MIMLIGNSYFPFVRGDVVSAMNAWIARFNQEFLVFDANQIQRKPKIMLIVNYCFTCQGRCGFRERWRLWMRYCVTIVHFSILVNGDPTGFFTSSRGLRQGDLLSPSYLLLSWNSLARCCQLQLRVIFCQASWWGILTLALPLFCIFCLHVICHYCDAD